MNIDTSCMSLMGMYWHFWVVSHELNHTALLEECISRMGVESSVGWE